MWYSKRLHKRSKSYCSATVPKGTFQVTGTNDWLCQFWGGGEAFFYISTHLNKRGEQSGCPPHNKTFPPPITASENTQIFCLAEAVSVTDRPHLAQFSTLPLKRLVLVQPPPPKLISLRLISHWYFIPFSAQNNLGQFCFVFAGQAPFSHLIHYQPMAPNEWSSQR